MELFKYVPKTSDWTILNNGKMLNNITSVMWIERYRATGEFQIKGKLGSGIMEDLPLGALISHTATLEVMIVENQEITQNKDEDATVTVSGRTYYSFLENRIVGMNQIRTNTNVIEYPFPADYTWNQAVRLINDHIFNANLNTPNDQIGAVYATTRITGTGASTARTIKRIDILKALLDLLEIDDLGVRTIRLNTFPGYYNTDNNNSYYEIYKGVDKTPSIVFSWDRGDISGADYLWSNKSMKTSAAVIGSKYNVVIDDPSSSFPGIPGKIRYYRKSTLADGSDIDGNYVYDVNTINALMDKMRVRAQQTIQNSNQISMTRLDIAPLTRYIYRRDYNLGDLVMVEGNFNVRSVMRVVEHAEIMDETGNSGHPTLALPLA